MFAELQEASALRHQASALLHRALTAMFSAGVFSSSVSGGSSYRFLGRYHSLGLVRSLHGGMAQQQAQPA